MGRGVIFLLSVLIGGQFGVDASTINFLTDALMSPAIRGSATRVHAFVCWSYELNTKFWQKLSACGIFASVRSDWQHWTTIDTIHFNYSTLFVIDLNCHNTNTFLKMADKSNLFASPHRWILIDELSGKTKDDFMLHNFVDNASLSLQPSSFQKASSDIFLESTPNYLDHLKAFLGSLKFNIDSQIIICLGVSQEKFRLVEVYRLQVRGNLQSIEVGSWDLTNGLILFPRQVKQKRQNLLGTELTTALVVTNEDTLKHLDDIDNKHIDTISKANYVMLRLVMEMMNASLKVVIVDSWGYVNPLNGSWGGMVGFLQRGDAEIGATALFVTSDRMDVIDYIASSIPTKITFVFRKPPLSYVSNVFTLPFSDSVWISSAVLVTLTAALLYAALVWEAKGSTRVGTGKATWSDVALLSLGAVCQQGSTVEPRGVPGRLVTLTLFIVVMFLYTSYSASIVSLLQSSTESINTLDDLLHSRLDVGVHDIVYNHHYFKTASDPLRKTFYEKKVASPPGQPSRFLSLDEGVRRLRKGLFAFNMEQSPGYQLISETFREEEKCGFKTIPFIQVIDPYVAMKKRSAYKNTFNVGFRKIQECGLRSRTLQQYYTKKPECTSHGSNFVSVGIVDFYPALLVLAYGVACSIGVLVIEVLVHKRQAYISQRERERYRKNAWRLTPFKPHGIVLIRTRH